MAFAGTFFVFAVLVIMIIAEFIQTGGNESDCLFEQLVNDGICDDKVNNFACDFDGGDCCNDNATAKLDCFLCKCYNGNLTIV
jgi:hypothetical protein